MDRRKFLQTATLAAGGAALAAADDRPAAAQGGTPAAPATYASGTAASDRWSRRSPTGAPVVRRFNEQEWLLDNVIATRGIDWDQGRTSGLIRACGDEAKGDMEVLKKQAKRYADIAPGFEQLARQREARAKADEAAGNKTAARDNYFIAAQYWASAMWPIDEANDRIRMYNARKNETFTKYIDLADHRIERAQVPYRGATLSGIFHLPPGYTSGKVPVIVLIQGMDGYKEKSVSLFGDNWMARGAAVLAFEGPGYWEAPLRGIYVDMAGWGEAGKAAFDWLAARPEVDTNKIGVTGSSYGSLFSVAMLAAEPRYKACAVTGTCYEPGGETIFNRASPTFKKRFMFMSGITDEAEFDDFRKTIDWKGYAERVKAPYLILSGEYDQLSPMEHTESFLKALGGPKQLVVYQGGTHSVTGSSAAVKGPEPRKLQSEWLMARLEGKPMDSERWFVDLEGKISKAVIS
jgi:dienelactone hydrolase